MPNISQPRLLSFTLDDWSALGGKVSVSLCDGVAVLVGKNGAGKSAILEGFEAISSLAIGRQSKLFNNIDSFPKTLDVEILTPTERRLQYRYERVVLPPSTDELDSTVLVSTTMDDSVIEDFEEGQLSWNERCQYIDGEQEVLWITDRGETRFSDGNIAVLGSTSSLRQTRFNMLGNPRLRLVDEMQWVHAVLNGIRLLGKNPIRQTYIRRPSLLQVSEKRSYPSGLLFRGVDSLARKIHRMKPEKLIELQSICQRIGLGNQVAIQEFFSIKISEEGSKEDNDEHIATILLDGINIGLLSDGTLRILTFLTELITSHSCATTIIEEPETHIHPGMLAKLLNEIEAYTFDENLILSTHSPQVVAWTDPDKINLVHRDKGRTIVRKLCEDEIQSVVEYLHDEGDLGEWLYSGILDE